MFVFLFILLPKPSSDANTSRKRRSSRFPMILWTIFGLGASGVHMSGIKITRY